MNDLFSPADIAVTFRWEAPEDIAGITVPDSARYDLHRLVRWLRNNFDVSTTVAVLKESIVAEIPFLVPGLGLYRVSVGARPKPRHAVLDFVAGAQQDTRLDAMVRDFYELASSYFEDGSDETLDDLPSTEPGLRLVT